MTKLSQTLIEILADNLFSLFGIHPNLVAIVADGLNSSKLHPINKAFPERIIQVGISEQDAVGTAVGLAYEGFLPFVFGYSAYLLPRAFEQARNHVAINRVRLAFVGTHAGPTAYNAGDTSFEDLALAGSIDMLNLYTPSDNFEIAQCLDAIVNDQRSAYVRIPNCTSTPPMDVDLDHLLSNANASFTLRKSGKNKCIISHGYMLNNVLEAFDKSPFAIYSCTQLNKPIDSKFLAVLETFDHVFFVEDHKIHGSYYQKLHVQNESQLGSINAHFIGVPNNFLCFESGDTLVKKLEMDTSSLVARVQSTS